MRRAKPAVVHSNLDTLLAEGIGERASKDMLIARDVCMALLCLKVPLCEFSQLFVYNFMVEFRVVCKYDFSLTCLT